MTYEDDGAIKGITKFTIRIQLSHQVLRIPQCRIRGVCTWRCELCDFIAISQRSKVVQSVRQ
jgi:hypothetical protein